MMSAASMTSPRAGDTAYAFLEIDDALFQAILESKIDLTLEQSEVAGTRFFEDLGVRSPHKSAPAVRREPNENVWEETPLPESASLRYMRLFDFGAFSGVERDFEFIQCAHLDDPSTDQQPNEFLVLARDATVTYIGSES
jgi:hypothetical protein